MTYFILLIVLLVLAIIFFITYPIVKKRVLNEKFNIFCGRKIKHFANKNKLHFINQPSFQEFDKKPEKIDQIIFGKKFIYIVADYCLLGEVNGKSEDSSWRYKKYNEKVSKYIDNLHDVADKNIKDFTGIINKNEDILVSICVVPDECDLLIEDINSSRVKIVHFSSLKSQLKKLENEQIGKLNNELLTQSFELLNGKNN